MWYLLIPWGKFQFPWVTELRRWQNGSPWATREKVLISHLLMPNASIYCCNICLKYFSYSLFVLHNECSFRWAAFPSVIPLKVPLKVHPMSQLFAEIFTFLFIYLFITLNFSNCFLYDFISLSHSCEGILARSSSQHYFSLLNWGLQAFFYAQLISRHTQDHCPVFHDPIWANI